MSIINFIRSKVEDKFKLDFDYVFKNFILIGGEQILSGVLGLALIYAIANFLSPEIAGEYKYLTSLATIIASFTLTGMMYGVTREVALGNNQILNFAFLKNLKFSLLPISIAFVVSTYYIYNSNYIYGISIMLATLFSTLTSVFLIYKSYLSGKENFNLSSRLAILTNSIVAIFSFTGFYYTNNLIYIIILSLGVQTLVSVLIYHKVSQKNKTLTLLSESIKRRYNTYVASQSFINFFNFGTMNFDKVLMFQFLGPKDLAIYAITTVLIDRIRGILKAAGTISYPKFVKANISFIRKDLRLQLIGFLILIAAFFVATLASLPFIFKYVLPQYQDYSLYADIYSITIFSALAIIPYTIFQAKNMTKYLYNYEIIGNSLQLVAVFVGMYYHGLLGAIVAKSISSIISTAVVFIFLRKAFR